MDWVSWFGVIIEVLLDWSVVFGGVSLFLIVRIFKSNAWLLLSIVFVGLLFELMFIYSGDRIRLTTLQELLELAPMILMYFSAISVWFFALVSLVAVWRKMFAEDEYRGQTPI